MRKMRVVSCESRMERIRRARISDSQFSILNSQFLLALLLFSAGSVAFAAPSRTATPTPTPRPKLTGGFGRAAATPIVAEGNGQSFADVVRAASEGKTRKEQKGSVAITNETLVTDPTKGKLTTSQPKNLPPPTPGRSETPAAASASTGGGEAEWRERARAARRRVEELKARVYQLEGEAASLEKDFYRWDDGQYRDGVIKPAWDKKKEELEATKNELAQAEKDLAELPDRARKAGALPGWIRE